MQPWLSIFLCRESKMLLSVFLLLWRLYHFLGLGIFGATQWTSWPEMEGHYWDLEPAVPGMLSTLQHRASQWRSVWPKMPIMPTPKRHFPGPSRWWRRLLNILGTILEMLWWNNNASGAQDAKLKLVLVRLAFFTNIFLTQVCFYDSQTVFYDSVYFTELLENKYLPQNRRHNIWLMWTCFLNKKALLWSLPHANKSHTFEERIHASSKDSFQRLL